jgi:transcription factor SFP1
MARPASPMDLGGSSGRLNSSPRSQASNLTFALQGAGVPQNTPYIATSSSGEGSRLGLGTHRESLSSGIGTHYGLGARPIQMKDRQRRESNTGSLVNGLSWGGLSVGSWIRDEYVFFLCSVWSSSALM